MQELQFAVPGFEGVSLMRRGELDALVDVLNSSLVNSLMLEVGTYDGVTAACIASKCPNSIIVSVDPFIHHDDKDTRPDSRPGAVRLVHWHKNRRLNMRLWVGNLTSFYAVSMQPFDLVLVDGAHDYESVLSDLRYGARLLTASGTLAVHDYADENWREVKEATDRFLSDCGAAHGMRIVESMALVKFED